MTQTASPQPPRMAKWMIDLQVFLLRRKLMGPANKMLMVITTTGRKSGRKYSIPIGCVPDGKSILAFNIGGGSNWYKNILANPIVTLEIEGKAGQYRGELIQDDADLLKALEVFKRERPNQLERFFGVAKDAAGADLLKAKARCVFVRFHPV